MKINLKMQVLDKSKALDIAVFKVLGKRLNTSLRFSKRLKPFTAKAIYHYNTKLLEVVASASWLAISDDIFQGMLEELLAKLFKKKFQSMNVKLYNNFLNKLPRVLQVDSNAQYPEVLTKSFERVNKTFFNNSLEMPKLRFKGFSKRTLAYYDFATNTISFSKLVEKFPENLVDYIMLHELLHYKLGFKHKFKNHYHHKEFKRLERELLASKGLNVKQLEAEISKYLKTL
ncbi:DUF45 domain-containing protein [Candidatus Woesearchaeota archaeon]|nr:DUF45 domain-containing protein [Candidatus Woesearchaeota archaeon]